MGKAFQEGDELSWHFDTNDWVLSLLLQESDEGGVFRYCPDIRSEQDENYEEVAGVLHGTAQQCVRDLNLQVGCLCLFRGNRSLHCVTRVGKTCKPRLILLLSY